MTTVFSCGEIKRHNWMRTSVAPPTTSAQPPQEEKQPNKKTQNGNIAFFPHSSFLLEGIHLLFNINMNMTSKALCLIP